MCQFPGHSPQQSASDQRGKQRTIEIESMFPLSLQWKSLVVETPKVLSGPFPLFMAALPHYPAFRVNLKKRNLYCVRYSEDDLESFARIGSTVLEFYVQQNLLHKILI